jgi:hypothetical protein
MGHDILGVLIAELKDIVYHLRFALTDKALLMSLVDEGDDLLLRDIL